MAELSPFFNRFSIFFAWGAACFDLFVELGSSSIGFVSCEAELGSSSVGWQRCCRWRLLYGVGDMIRCCQKGLHCLARQEEVWALEAQEAEDRRLTRSDS